MGDETPETYRTLENNLKRSGFRQADSSFRYTRQIEGASVIVEFLCETREVEPGRIYRPKGEGTGSGLGAFNVRGAHLVSRDHFEREIEAERLDGGGRSTVVVKVANLLPYLALEILAFQDRHENKDAYDMIFCLLNTGSGPRTAGTAAAGSPIANEELTEEALQLLHERFQAADLDGPTAYAAFLATPGDPETQARLRRDAVAAVREFLEGFREG